MLLCRYSSFDLLNRYLGIELSLPAQKERKSDWRSHPEKEKLLKTYGSLNEKIEAADDVKIWQPEP